MNLEMNALIGKAAGMGWWLHCNYQDLWFSPEELQTNQAKGKFCWGAQNWTIRNPQEMIDEAQQRVASALRELERTKARVRSK